MTQTLYKYLLTLILCLVYILPIMAQETFYVYRNDGVLHGFFNEDVDSMLYSKIDIDSVEHNDYVVQEIYTKDSVFRIPLAAIDSVGFVTPQTVYKPGVIDMGEELCKYVISSTDTTILLQSSTPIKLIPKKDDKLVYMEMTEIFPIGFAGEVVSVSTIQEGIMVNCALVDLEDIFDSYYGTTTVSQPMTRGLVKNGKITVTPGTFSLPINALKQIISSLNNNNDYAIEANSDFRISFTPEFKVSAMVIIDKEHGKYFSLSCVGDYVLRESISLSGNLSFGKDFGIDIPQVPIPVCPFIKFYFEPGLFFNASVTGAMKQEWTQHYRSAIMYDYSSKGQSVLKPVNTMVMVNSSYSGEATISGSVSAGAYAESGFAIADKNFANLHLRAEGGYELESNAVLYKKEMNTAIESAQTYERLKNTRLSFNKIWGASAEAVFLDYTKSHSLLDRKEPLLSFGFVPSFNGLGVSQDKDNPTNANATGYANGTCFRPVNVGLLVKDENGKTVDKYFSSQSHQSQITKIENKFTNLKDGKKYTLHPIVNLYGIEMLASPSKEFELEKEEPDAEITGIECLNLYSEDYGDGTKAGFLFFKINAVLNNLEDVVEWGYYHYYNDSKIAEFEFDKVATNGSQTTYTGFVKTNPSADGVKIDYNNFRIYYTTKKGLYVKKKNEDGTIRTVYGPIKEYDLVYDDTKRPSITLSDLNVGQTVDISEDKWDRQIFYSHKVNISGLFWMDEVFANRIGYWEIPGIVSIGFVHDGTNEMKDFWVKFSSKRAPGTDYIYWGYTFNGEIVYSTNCFKYIFNGPSCSISLEDVNTVNMAKEKNSENNGKKTLPMSGNITPIVRNIINSDSKLKIHNPNFCFPE